MIQPHVTFPRPPSKTSWLGLLKLLSRQAPQKAKDLLETLLQGVDPKLLVWQWLVNARAEQLPPEVEYFCWMVMAGRGFGKTRTGSETVRGWVEKQPWAWGGTEHIPAEPVRVALLADNAEDAVKVMIKGRSGLLNVCPPWARPRFKPSEKALYWPNGGMAFYYSAEDAEQLRGPEHHVAWVDELAKFRNPVDPWDNLLMGLRLGTYPRVVVTTTPRPHPILSELLAEHDTHLTRGSTYDNEDNLPQRFLDKLMELYEGTRVGRQEVYAELLTDVEGALFSSSNFDINRLKAVPSGVDLIRVTVNVDPPATSTERANLCGITVTAKGSDNHGYLLADRSLKQARPEDWGREAVAAYMEFEADLIVAEVNNGGEMVEHVVRTVQPDVSYKAVHATRGKVTRAEPCSALYQQNRIHHVGGYKELEDQLLLFAPGVKFDDEFSPDRADSIVWGWTELFDLADVGSFSVDSFRSLSRGRR
jgi:phage terminase large subunit-like protein